jgi:hypothetical protein
MSLPELEWQIIYGRAAWVIVLAALAIAGWPRSRQLSRSAIVLLFIGAVALNALPNEASLSYWLGLAFTWPSGLLVGLCLARLYFSWNGASDQAAMPAGLAAPIAIAGLALYLDAMGLLSQGFYYLGFEPIGAPLLTLFLAVACCIAAALGHARPPVLALLLALTIFALLRLPTGNLWDALLDPILWVWALVSLGSRCWRWRTRRDQARSTENVHMLGSQTNS